MTACARLRSSLFRGTGPDSTEDDLDGRPREIRLRNEAQGRAFADQIREVILRMGRDEDYVGGGDMEPGCQLAREFESALFAEVDIHKYQVRCELLRTLKTLGNGRGDPDHAHPLPVQHGPRGRQERRVVIDDEAAQGTHKNSMAAAIALRIAASGN